MFDALKPWQKAVGCMMIAALAALGYYVDFQYRRWIIRSAIQDAAETKPVEPSR